MKTKTCKTLNTAFRQCVVVSVEGVKIFGYMSMSNCENIIPKVTFSPFFLKFCDTPGIHSALWIFTVESKIT